MRIEFKPEVLLTGVTGLALGHYGAVAAKSSGGSGGSDDKKQMSCDEAVERANIAIAVGTVLLTFGTTPSASFCFGFAAGLMAASCPTEQPE